MVIFLSCFCQFSRQKVSFSSYHFIPFDKLSMSISKSLALNLPQVVLRWWSQGPCFDPAQLAEETEGVKVPGRHNKGSVRMRTVKAGSPRPEVAPLDSAHGLFARLAAPRLKRVCMSIYQIHSLELLQRGQLPRLQLTSWGLTALPGREIWPSLNPLPSSGEPSRARRGLQRALGWEPWSCNSSLSSATKILGDLGSPRLTLSFGFLQNGRMGVYWRAHV